MAAQSAELLAMEDELKAFRRNWEKNFRGLQERHKKEQERLFELDNFGFEMWGNCARKKESQENSMETKFHNHAHSHFIFMSCTKNARDGL